MSKLENALGAVLVGGVAVLGGYGLFVGATGLVLGARSMHVAAPAPAPASTESAATASAASPDVAPAAEAPAKAPETPAGSVDLAAGEKAFAACKACHSITSDLKDGTGPHLWGVFNRPVASVEGFAYSDAMKGFGAGKAWDQALLDAFLTNPKAEVPGTKMTFAGIKDATKRANLIGWIAQQADTPVTLAGGTASDAPAADAPAATDAAPAGPFADLADDAVVTLDPVPYPEGVTYSDVPPLTADEIAKLEAKAADIKALLPKLDYQAARYFPIHFSPLIEKASSQECLVCHQEILDAKPRVAAPAGNTAAESLAWYQTLDTYAGPQSDFHWRHIESDFAKQVMKLECNFCHKGNDPREESPDVVPTSAAFSAPATPAFTLRKMVNPSETCLRCHGAMPDPENIMGLAGPWPEARLDLETPEAPDGCLTCHADTFRTNRHQVNYLNAATIEDLARNGTSDTCYGCHGGRQWYRISYPYPRHPWPTMDASTVPDWAKDRPVQSKPEDQLAPAP